MALGRLPERSGREEYPLGVEKAALEKEAMTLRGRRMSLIGEDCQLTVMTRLVIGALTPAFGGLLAT